MAAARRRRKMWCWIITSGPARRSIFTGSPMCLVNGAGPITIPWWRPFAITSAGACRCKSATVQIPCGSFTSTMSSARFWTLRPGPNMTRQPPVMKSSRFIPSPWGNFMTLSSHSTRGAGNPSSRIFPTRWSNAFIPPTCPFMTSKIWLTPWISRRIIAAGCSSWSNRPMPGRFSSPAPGRASPAAIIITTPRSKNSV